MDHVNEQIIKARRLQKELNDVLDRLYENGVDAVSVSDQHNGAFISTKRRVELVLLFSYKPAA